MTEARLDFATLAEAQRVEPVVLIAGLPVVFTVGGTRPTTVSVSSGALNGLWWPGTGSLTETLPGGAPWNPVRDLLDPRTVWSFASALALVDGNVTVEPVAIDFLDTGGAATALFSRRSAATAQLLAAELSASGTTATLVSTTGLPSAGVAHIGREAVGYTGKTSTTLTGLTRGLFGSAALPHRVGLNRGATDPLVVANTLPRYIQGRRATVWLCRVVGTTLRDPTLVFSGIVGAGVTLVGNGARWQLTLDPMTDVLSRAPDLPVELYGWHHGNTVNSGLTPLTYLGPTVNDGWSPSLQAVIDGWNFNLRSGTGVTLERGTDGRLLARNSGGVYTPAILRSYLTPNELSVASGASASFDDGPDTCLVLEGVVKLAPNDFARVPSTLTYSVTDPAPGTAHVALVADTDETEHFAALVASRDAGTSTVTLAARSTARATERIREARITKRTTARVGFIARGDHCLGALKALATALAQTGGSDDFASAIDWDRIAEVFRGVPSVGIPEGREYEIGAGDDSLTGLLIDEARLRGCTLTMRGGRLSVVRAASFAASEAVGVPSITEADQLCDANGDPVPLEIVDQPEPPATTISFAIKGDVELRYTDDTFAAEFGSSKVAECGALRWLPAADGPARELPVHALARVAQQILGVLAEPQRIIKVPLAQPSVGLEPGDIVTLTHSAVPAWDGTRGVTDAVCQVDEVQRELFGGSARVTVSLRLGETGIGGYAPEALVAAGGLSGSSAVVTLDTSSAFGASCFAPPGESPAYGFAVGDVVVLSQHDAATITVTEIQRTLVAVDLVAHTVTLDSVPSAGMVTQAAGAYGVVLRTAAWTVVTAGQQSRSAFVADDSTNAFSDGADPKHWAA